MTPNIADWVGKTVTDTQRADLWPARGLAAALDKPFDAREGDAIPLLAHWCYFTPMVPQSQIGFDGHPERGYFIPPIPQPRRMWAASNIEFHAPIRFGDEMTKHAKIASIEEKEGATGKLIFLKVTNNYSVGGTLCLSETQTIVYRDPPEKTEQALQAKSAPADAEWSAEVTTHPTRLFRYSAVTFNAHQIHYDYQYVTKEEGYPGLIVQGQLIATTLLEAFQVSKPDILPKSFSFRAVKPIFAHEVFRAEGAAKEGQWELWASGAEKDLRMLARVVA